MGSCLFSRVGPWTETHDCTGLPDIASRRTRPGQPGMSAYLPAFPDTLLRPSYEAAWRLFPDVRPPEILAIQTFHDVPGVAGEPGRGGAAPVLSLRSH
ncbi:hypothetical protein Ssi03_26170 [Sphaerisporangium siamense]|uniref:Uncharacterized protein n=1 Tax=Sphaerisporangium siamense TaxID=795645 RepID=A0A7W7D669_9ACTN|nr:hypothetical protein [Sphaerisporangium siamense]GII84627.1 hypothetical protein Ssi03_26170 [Sphaerisporangium siamense]